MLLDKSMMAHVGRVNLSGRPAVHIIFALLESEKFAPISYLGPQDGLFAQVGGRGILRALIVALHL